MNSVLTAESDTVSNLERAGDKTTGTHFITEVKLKYDHQSGLS